MVPYLPLCSRSIPTDAEDQDNEPPLENAITDDKRLKVHSGNKKERTVLRPDNPE